MLENKEFLFVTLWIIALLISLGGCYIVESKRQKIKGHSIIAVGVVFAIISFIVLII